jgi:hypothetical protein
VQRNLFANSCDDVHHNLFANSCDDVHRNLFANSCDNVQCNLFANSCDNVHRNLFANSGDNVQQNLFANSCDNVQRNLCANNGDNVQRNLCANSGDNVQNNLYANSGDNVQRNLFANIGDNVQRNLFANTEVAVARVTPAGGSDNLCREDVNYVLNSPASPEVAVNQMALSGAQAARSRVIDSSISEELGVSAVELRGDDTSLLHHARLPLDSSVVAPYSGYQDLVRAADAMKAERWREVRGAATPPPLRLTGLSMRLRPRIPTRCTRMQCPATGEESRRVAVVSTREWRRVAAVAEAEEPLVRRRILEGSTFNGLRGRRKVVDWCPLIFLVRMRETCWRNSACLSGRCLIRRSISIATPY